MLKNRFEMVMAYIIVFYCLISLVIIFIELSKNRKTSDEQYQALRNDLNKLITIECVKKDK